MTTKWLLYLISALLIALIYIYLGWETEQNPDGALASGFGFRSKKLKDVLSRDALVRSWAQTRYGSAEKKGGFALAVLSAVGMLCVLNQSDQAVTIAAAVLFLAEILFFFALRIWCARKVDERFGSSLSQTSPAPAVSEPDADRKEEEKEKEEEASVDPAEADGQQKETGDDIEAAESAGSLLSDGTLTLESAELETVTETHPDPKIELDPAAPEDDVDSRPADPSAAADDGADWADTRMEEEASDRTESGDSDDSYPSGGVSSSFPLPPESLRKSGRSSEPMKAAEGADSSAEIRTAAEPIDSLPQETESVTSLSHSQTAACDFGLDSSAAEALADLQTRLSLSLERTAEKPHLHRADRHPASPAAAEDSVQEPAGSFSYRTLAASWNGSSGTH